MTLSQQMLTVALVVIGTMVTRFLPFIIFPEGKKTPRYISYLGRVLPFAVIGLLVVYSLQDAFYTDYRGLPEGVSALFIGLLHRWKGSMLLSIAGGTVFYMILVQYIFI